MLIKILEVVGDTIICKICVRYSVQEISGVHSTASSGDWFQLY